MALMKRLPDETLNNIRFNWRFNKLKDLAEWQDILQRIN